MGRWIRKWQGFPWQVVGTIEGASVAVATSLVIFDEVNDGRTVASSVGLWFGAAEDVGAGIFVGVTGRLKLDVSLGLTIGTGSVAWLVILDGEVSLGVSTGAGEGELPS